MTKLRMLSTSWATYRSQVGSPSCPTPIARTWTSTRSLPNMINIVMMTMRFRSPCWPTATTQRTSRTCWAHPKLLSSPIRRTRTRASPKTWIRSAELVRDPYFWSWSPGRTTPDPCSVYQTRAKTVTLPAHKPPKRSRRTVEAVATTRKFLSLALIERIEPRSLSPKTLFMKILNILPSTNRVKVGILLIKLTVRRRNNIKELKTNFPN